MCCAVLTSVVVEFNVMLLYTMRGKVERTRLPGAPSTIVTHFQHNYYQVMLQSRKLCLCCCYTAAAVSTTASADSSVAAASVCVYVGLRQITTPFCHNAHRSYNTSPHTSCTSAHCSVMSLLLCFNYKDKHKTVQCSRQRGDCLDQLYQHNTKSSQSP